MKSVWKSGPPQARLATSSGTRTLPISSPEGAYTHTPPGPVHQTLPRELHFMPSGRPGSRSDARPLANTRPFMSEP